MTYESRTTTSGRRLWPWLLAAGLALVLAGVGVLAGTLLAGDEQEPAVASTSAIGDTDPTPAATETDEVDPYEQYLQLAPDDAPDLSRDDAQARAMLGCGSEWAPGTVDAALQEAYADLVAEMEGCRG